MHSTMGVRLVASGGHVRLEGLQDLPPIHNRHPWTTPLEPVGRILALSLEHPAWGCNQLSDLLKLECVSIGAPTIQNILNTQEIGLSQK